MIYIVVPHHLNFKWHDTKYTFNLQYFISTMKLIHFKWGVLTYVWHHIKEKEQKVINLFFPLKWNQTLKWNHSIFIMERTQISKHGVIIVNKSHQAFESCCAHYLFFFPPTIFSSSSSFLQLCPPFFIYWFFFFYIIRWVWDLEVEATNNANIEAKPIDKQWE